MPRCKNCKYGKWSGCNRDETYNKFTDKMEGWQGRSANVTGNCKYYMRKRWKLWAPKVLLVTLALLRLAVKP